MYYAHRRQYQIAPHMGAPYNIKETVFIGKGLNWRKKIWPEVSKTVLRKRKMREIFKPIKLDAKSIDGMVLSSDQKGTKLTTSSVKDVSSAGDSFRPPKSFALMDCREFLTQVRLAVKQPKAKADPSKQADKTSCQLLTLMTPAFLRVFSEGC